MTNYRDIIPALMLASCYGWTHIIVAKEEMMMMIKKIKKKKKKKKKNPTKVNTHWLDDMRF
jgi:uncharacterized protein involved in tolerance to divalent cations